MREGKSTSSKIIATVDSGLPIRVLDTTGNWWQVMTKDNEIGYIHKSRIKKGKTSYEKYKKVIGKRTNLKI